MGITLNQSIITLVGGGGHASVVREAAELSGWLVAGYFDDEVRSTVAREIPRLGNFRDSLQSDLPSILAVGDLTTRFRFVSMYRGPSATVVHPSATVSRHAVIQSGTFIGATAVVNPYSEVGLHVIVNTRAVIEHHCRVARNCHIGPGAVLGGNVVIGENTLIGMSASVNPGVRIGKNCIVGAGAVVTRDVADGELVIGVPARAATRQFQRSA